MPLSEPIDEAIFQEIVSRLQIVDGSTIVEYRREPGNWTPTHRQICIVKKTPERVPELDYPGNPPAMAWRMPVNLRLHFQQSETDTMPGSTAISEFIAEVHQEICLPDNWYQWDGKAVDTQFGNTELVSPTGAFDVAVIGLLVTYRHSEGDPFEVR